MPWLAMIRLLALTFAATLAMLTIALAMGHAPARPVEAARAASLNPWSKDAPPPERWHMVAAISAQPTARPDPGATTITRDSTGHFHVTGEVNGQSSEFLVDTGADLVALTRDEAQRLGIFVSPGDFRPILRTASGTAQGAPVQIDRLTIGGSELHNVAAVVVDGLGTNLLGQSALRQLGKLEQDGDRMVIDPG